MKYFDLHCDTAFEMYHRKMPLAANALSVSLDGFDAYERKAQVFAVWSDVKRSPDDAYADFFAIFDNLKNEIENNADRAVLCTDAETLKADDARLKIIPAVEGAHLIGKDLSRLEILREYGIRALTLTWGGTNELGGAFDTDEGLTEFGFRAVEMCEKLGILIDVSHLSEKGFWDLVKVAKRPFFASHSDAQAICLSPRNLSDTQLRTIVSGGGIVGVGLIGKYLSKSLEEDLDAEPDEVLDTAVRHVVHFIEKGCGKNVAIGADLDGTAQLKGLERVEKLGALGAYMQDHGADLALVEDIFYNNAYSFFMKNL